MIEILFCLDDLQIVANNSELHFNLIKFFISYSQQYFTFFCFSYGLSIGFTAAYVGQTFNPTSHKQQEFEVVLVINCMWVNAVCCCVYILVLDQRIKPFFRLRMCFKQFFLLSVFALFFRSYTCGVYILPFVYGHVRRNAEKSYLIY